MKILLITDTHGLIPEKTENVELILHAGDISFFEEDLGKILKKWDTLNIPIFLIHGNHESEEAIEFYIKKLKNIQFIHNKIIIFKNIIIAGIGGGGFSYSNPDTKSIEIEMKRLKIKKLDIFITHAPPYGTNLDLLENEHVGNIEFRRFIEKYQPKICVCGHLHENFGKMDKIGTSKLVNPGFEGAIIEI
ncbi:MAG: metallophosphoesterase family protein [Candidatus Woesearchaeota archaeon]